MANHKAGNKKNSKGEVELAPQQGRSLQQRGGQKPPEPSKAAEKALTHPFLGRELRVELVDRRILVGTLIAYMGLGDLLLQNAVEQRRYADGELSWRSLNLVAIPLKHVTAMHRRLPDCEPITFVEG
ncbi:hypothetical protein C3747_168g50 [Trypanosoma cruzi]|uniref:LSM domain-containing protein n=2 Tax=Trypanosoma cruzi TaxID=5693 RepID=Q4D5K9_TRYCC|nr:hypothetical protein, conserved [Trypanosoma cruzi]EAN87814.1 hypothetical protein, conserved [Trypanosoma cruzi]PWV03846.1 hypothetical protein C3747_168g50 [Trypanosoma cruzi]RNC61928.1 hypothetical protein TcCL_ESM00316 [Trypanosoma cruzi]|eukprot:XP_809665.1 hypothetical protein [Trypanosoma cruzi strain CL Brener]